MFGWGRKRKIRHRIRITFHELQHVAFNSGTIFCKFKFKDNSEKGSTNHVDISQHFVKWEQKFEFEVDMTVDNESKFIQPLLMRISVRQELDSNRSKHKRLGVVTIDLSEYVTKTSGTGNAITRVFLLQESKMNSLVKLSIAIDNLSSDTDYQCSLPSSDASHAEPSLPSSSSSASIPLSSLPSHRDAHASTPSLSASIAPSVSIPHLPPLPPPSAVSSSNSLLPPVGPASSHNRSNSGNFAIVDDILHQSSSVPSVIRNAPHHSSSSSSAFSHVSHSSQPSLHPPHHHRTGSSGSTSSAGSANSTPRQIVAAASSNSSSFVDAHHPLPGHHGHHSHSSSSSSASVPHHHAYAGSVSSLEDSFRTKRGSWSMPVSSGPHRNIVEGSRANNEDVIADLLQRSFASGAAVMSRSHSGLLHPSSGGGSGTPR